MMAGLTSQQRALLDSRWCDNGHRFNGANYPTPEGVCPFCAWPEFQEEVSQYERLVAEQTSQPREPLHPAIGLLAQAASPSLTASSER